MNFDILTNDYHHETFIECVDSMFDAGYVVAPLYGLTKDAECDCHHENCQNVLKHPRFKGWTSMVNLDETTLEQWKNMRLFNYAYGIVLGDDDLVVDFDPRNNENALVELNNACGLDIKALSKFVVRTGSGGLHMYFKKPEDFKTRKNLPEIKGIDFLTKGAFCVGVGSLHKTGNVYEAVSVRQDDPSKVADAPDSLLSLIERKVYVNENKYEAGCSDIDELRSALNYVPNDSSVDYDSWIKIGAALHFETSGSLEGYDLWVDWSSRHERHDETQMGMKWQSFGGMVERKATAGTIFHIAFENGWERDFDVDIDINSFLSKFSSCIDEPVFLTKEDSDDKIVIDKLPSDFNTLSGVIGDIVKYTMETAKKPLLVPSLNMAIGLAGLFTSRDFTTDHDNYSSMYFLSLADSGGGKEYPMKVAKQILAAVDKHEQAKADTSSKSAIVTELYLNPRSIFLKDEVAEWFAAGNSKGGSDLKKSEIQAVMELYSKTDSFFASDSLSNTRGIIENKIKQGDKSRVIVERPAATIVGTTTPAKLSVSLSRMQIEDGLLNRFIIGFAYEGSQKINLKTRQKPVPNSILSWIEAIERRLQQECRKQGIEERDAATSPMHPIKLSFSDDAYEALSNYEDKVIERKKELDKDGIGVLSVRNLEKVMRMALVIELSKNPYATEIGADSVSWAAAYIDYTFEQFVKYVKFEMTENNVDKLYKDAYNAILSYGKSGAKKTELFKGAPFKSMKSGEVRDVIDYLTSRSEQVKVFNINSGRGRPKEVYVADAYFKDWQEAIDELEAKKTNKEEKK